MEHSRLVSELALLRAKVDRIERLPLYRVAKSARGALRRRTRP